MYYFDSPKNSRPKSTATSGPKGMRDKPRILYRTGQPD